MIDKSIFQKDLAILKVLYSSNNKVAKYLWQKLTELRRELETLTFIKTKFKIFSPVLVTTIPPCLQKQFTYSRFITNTFSS